MDVFDSAKFSRKWQNEPKTARNSPKPSSARELFNLCAMQGTRASRAYDAAMKHAEAERAADVEAARRTAEEEAAQSLALLRKQLLDDKAAEIASLRRVAGARLSSNCHT